jgi:tRNA-dihydrouridine synthase
MVGQSELAFRMLVRQFGCHVCATPMIDAAGYVKSERYRQQFSFDQQEKDHPLIVQFCGNNADMLVKAGLLSHWLQNVIMRPSQLIEVPVQLGLLVQSKCDGVEINVGCPQRCARKGKYGAYLMDR